ncbi:hypothetical protein VUR80DRAFT_6834 [Thermomyces stellatus]
MVDEPDAATAASNSNGWVILQEEELHKDELWTWPIFRRWVETTTVVSSPTQINGALYAASGIVSPNQRQGHDVDAMSGYLYEDDIESPHLQHYYCDIDTVTGELLPPLKQPRTHPAPPNRFDDSEPYRKDRTSEDIIMENVSRKAVLKSWKKSTPEKAYQDAILAVEEDLRRRRPMKLMMGHRYPVAGAVSFRPAVGADIDAATKMYNAEVMGAGMVPDSSPVPVNHFLQILQACQGNTKPFIVAVKNTNRLADVSNWPDRTAFEDWMRLKRAQGEPIEKEEVVGCAFLCPFDYGIWGSEGNARYSARIRCFVSPKHRRQGIGRALIDLMLQMTVTGYTAKCDSEWKLNRPSQAFSRKAFDNDKKYHRVFIEAYFKNRGDPALEGMKILLENQLGFTPMGHILGGYMTERGEESVFLDKLIWGMDAVHQDEIGWYRSDVRTRAAS